MVSILNSGTNGMSDLDQLIIRNVVHVSIACTISNFLQSTVALIFQCCQNQIIGFTNIPLNDFGDFVWKIFDRQPPSARSTACIIVQIADCVTILIGLLNKETIIEGQLSTLVRSDGIAVFITCTGRTVDLVGLDFQIQSIFIVVIRIVVVRTITINM